MPVGTSENTGRKREWTLQMFAQQRGCLVSKRCAHKSRADQTWLFSLGSDWESGQLPWLFCALGETVRCCVRPSDRRGQSLLLMLAVLIKDECSCASSLTCARYSRGLHLSQKGSAQNWIGLIVCEVGRTREKARARC